MALSNYQKAQNGPGPGLRSTSASSLFWTLKALREPCCFRRRQASLFAPSWPLYLGTRILKIQDGEERPAEAWPGPENWEKFRSHILPKTCTTGQKQLFSKTLGMTMVFFTPGQAWTKTYEFQRSRTDSATISMLNKILIQFKWMTVVVFDWCKLPKFS